MPDTAVRPVSYTEIECLYFALLRSVHQSRLPSEQKRLRWIEINSALDYLQDQAKWQRLLDIAVDLAWQMAEVQR